MPAHYLEIIVVALGLAVLMIEAFVPLKDKASLAWFAVFGLLIVFGALFCARAPEAAGSTVFWSPDFYAVDSLALFYKGIAVLTTILVLVMAVEYRSILTRYLANNPGQPEAGLGEFFALPLFTCAGLMWMASANNLISIFVALESVTIGFYVLVAYMRRNVGSLEAGVKYLILGALSTGFLVYGFTWLFGITGETRLDLIAAELQSPDTNTTAALFAFALILVALGFKVGAVPFQLWIPDVYQGAPTPVTAFLSVGSKAAGFVVLLRVVDPFLASGVLSAKVAVILAIVAGATLVFGNLAAIPQTNFKRLLAYSSISHAGFLLVAVASRSEFPGEITHTEAVSYYLAAYLFMTLLTFLVLAIVRVRFDSEQIDAFDGLARHSPFLAASLLVAMASLAGIPLTAGFVGKWFVFQVALQERHYVLVALAVLGAGAGFYYYLKVVRAMFWNDAPATDAADRSAAAISLSIPARITLFLLLAAIIVFGFYPTPILNLLA